MKNSTLADTGNGISIFGGVGWVYGWLSSIDWLTVVGVLVAIFGFVMNAYYSHRRDCREKEKHDLEVEMMKRGLNDEKHNES